MAKIAGIDFDFGVAVLTIPPLSLGDLELLQDRLGKLKMDMFDTASVGTVIDATLAALKRNYPDITREGVADMIDVANMPDVIQCVMDVAGMRRKEIDAGKSQAAVTTTQ